MKKIMKKTLLVLVLVASVLALSFNLLACDKPEAPEVNSGYPIPEGLNINIELINGNTSLGTITNETLKDVDQQKVTMNTVNSYGTQSTVVYIAYKLTDIIDKLDITLPTISRVRSLASDNWVIDAANITNAYITIGTEESETFKTDEDAPRYITDSTSEDSSSINKSITKITFNYVELNIETTIDGEAKSFTVPNSRVASDVEVLTHEDNKGRKFDGFNLKDILKSVATKKKGSPLVSHIEDYTSIGFVCSDDKDGEDYSKRIFTKAEIESADNYIRIVKEITKDGSIETRCFSDLGEPSGVTKDTYRDRLKKITKIVVNGTDAKTLEISWTE